MTNKEYIEKVNTTVCELKALRAIGSTLPNQNTDTTHSLRVRFQQSIEALQNLENELKDEWLP